MLVAISLADSLRAGRKILPVVPLFHVNAWGVPYAAPLIGASMVFPGPKLDGASLWELMDREQVFSAWGVPTVWLGLLAEIRRRGRPPEGLGDVVIGGSAAPRAMIEAFEAVGVNVNHAWGMTEMSPIGTQGNLPPAMQDLPAEERIRLKCTQGRRAFGVDLKICDEDGARMPHDGRATGELHVRGNAVIREYYEDGEATAGAFDAEGWFRTGDIAAIDERGFLTITDRAKDLIKSGGEWISSIDLENVVMSPPRRRELRRDRRAAPQMGRAPPPVRRSRRGRAAAGARRAHGPPRPALRQMAAPRRRGLRGGPAHDRHRQGVQAHAPPAVRGPRAAGGGERLRA